MAAAAQTPQAYGRSWNDNSNGTYNDIDHPHRLAPSHSGTSGQKTQAHTSASLAYAPSHQPATASSSSNPQHQEFYAPAPTSSHNNHQFLSPNDAVQYNSDHVHDRTHDLSQQQFEPDHLYAPAPTRPTGKFTEEWDASQRGSSIINGPVPSRHNTVHSARQANNMSSIQRSNSFSGSANGAGTIDGSSIQMSRSNTLKKKASLRRSGSLKRFGSRRSMKAGSVKSLALQSNTDEDEMHNAFFCPVPTTGNPTEALANRFQAWRKVLKDIIMYFKEIQTTFDQKSKSLVKLANVLNNVHMPPGFLPSGGLDDAVQILRTYNAQAILEANKAREIEEDVILALTGLRSDLQLKIKEIKSLSGDFKNSVEKEMDATRKAVRSLQETLGKSELDSAMTTGKEDPYLLRLAVDRQVERQLDEENYLHQAYLNLENSGRELESIVVGEIQKSYNAYAGILKREAESAFNAIEELRVGPIAMPKDHEWSNFVQKDDQFVDPAIPIRSAQYIHYPGKDHYACQEIRAGLLERKTKYLKSYTAGWYVLSPTHLHEFKSADKTQSPVMSLYLPEQKLGSHSQEAGSSPKFILKGRQAGGVHRGHSWVFRAESFDTMMAWYEDIKFLTEKTPQERNDFIRGHSRSFSRTSSRRSISSDGVVDEDDEEPYSAHNSAAALGQPGIGTGFQQDVPRRPSPGGRFPSDIEVNANRGLQAPLSPSSINLSRSSSDRQADKDNEIIAAAGALPGSSFDQYYSSVPVDSAPRTGYGQQMAQGPEYAGQQPNPAAVPYANHPATIIASQTAQDNPAATEQPNAKQAITHEASWLAGGIPVEAASTPIENRRTPQPVEEEFPNGLGPSVSLSHSNGLPASSVLMTPAANGNGSTLQRPAVSERMESDAPTLSSEVPTLSSEVQTISNLHIPGEYPRAACR